MHSQVIYCMFHYEGLEVGRNSWYSLLEATRISIGPYSWNTCTVTPWANLRMEYEMGKWDYLSLPTETSCSALNDTPPFLIAPSVNR